MEVANASLYDGGTALYEAAMMALRITGPQPDRPGRRRQPDLPQRCSTCYTSNLSIDFEEIPVVHGQSDRDAHRARRSTTTRRPSFCRIPNFFGAVDDFTDIVETGHEQGRPGDRVRLSRSRWAC